MWSACLDEYQHAVGRHYDLVLFGRNRWILVLAQGFLDLLFDLQKSAYCVCCPLYGGGFLQHSPQRCAADAQALGSTLLVAVLGLQCLLHGDLLDLFQSQVHR